jgi:hypothetical protein
MDLDLPGGHYSPLHAAREFLQDLARDGVDSLSQIVTRYAGEKLDTPAHVLCGLCYHAWCWTAAVRYRGNPTSPTGRAWAKDRWAEFGQALNAHAARRGIPWLEQKARGLVLDLSSGRREQEEVLLLDRLFRELGGKASEFRIVVEPRARPPGTKASLSDAARMVYEVLLVEARASKPCPTYETLQAKLRIGPNTVRGAFRELERLRIFRRDRGKRWELDLARGLEAP